MGSVRHLQGWDAEPLDGRGMPHVSPGKQRHFFLECHLAEQLIYTIAHIFSFCILGVLLMLLLTRPVATVALPHAEPDWQNSNNQRHQQ